MHDRQALAGRLSPAVPKGIMSTGINDEQLHVHPTLVHPFQDPRDRDGTVLDIIGRMICADGSKKVHACDLETITSEKEQPGTAAGDSPREVLNGALHGGFVGIAEERDVKAKAAQEGSHVSRVVGGIGKGTVRIGGVANNQGAPVLLRWRCGRLWIDAYRYL